jgi:Fe2+ transport protein
MPGGRRPPATRRVDAFMRKLRGRSTAILSAVMLASLCAGCGFGPAAAGNTTIPNSGMTGMSGMTGTSGTAPSCSGKTISMSMGGVKAMAICPIGQATWQGMHIVAETTKPVPFVVFEGTTMREIKPTARDNAHLMVMLTDALTHTPIPYATVWATIRKNGKIIFDQRQWPMLSRYMGVHYGNNVPLHGSGEYTLDLLIGPPVSARHMEYAHVWLKPHRVQFTFHWKAA